MLPSEQALVKGHPLLAFKAATKGRIEISPRITWQTSSLPVYPKASSGPVSYAS
jgi:hypothetical protein